MKKYYEEINIARGIAIFLVVLGHSFPDSQLNIYNNSFIYRNIFNTIYSFHMPLFFMISGFLSYKLICINDIMEKKKALKDKFMRLMLPYLIISIPSLILKYIFVDFAYKSFNFKFGFLEILVGRNPNGGLWFLYTLFLVYFIAIYINKYYFKLICVLFFILYFIPNTNVISIFTISYICKQGLFYFIGIAIYLKYDKFKKIIENKYINIIALIILFLGNYIVTLNNLKIGIINLIISFSGILLTIKLSIIISKVKSKVNYMFNILGDYSYDIYLISYFVQIPIRVILFTKFDFNYEVTIILMLSLGIIIPILISRYFIRKISILNIFILGNYKKVLKSNQQ